VLVCACVSLYMNQMIDSMVPGAAGGAAAANKPTAADKNPIAAIILSTDVFALGWCGFAGLPCAARGPTLVLPFLKISCDIGPRVAAFIDDLDAQIDDDHHDVQHAILTVVAAMLDAGTKPELVRRVHDLLPVGYGEPFLYRIMHLLRFCPDHPLLLLPSAAATPSVGGVGGGRAHAAPCEQCSGCIRHAGIRQLELEVLTRSCASVACETDARAHVARMVCVGAVEGQDPALAETSPVANEAAALLAALWTNALARSLTDGLAPAEEALLCEIWEGTLCCVPVVQCDDALLKLLRLQLVLCLLAVARDTLWSAAESLCLRRPIRPIPTHPTSPHILHAFVVYMPLGPQHPTAPHRTTTPQATLAPCSLSRPWVTSSGCCSPRPPSSPGCVGLRTTRRSWPWWNVRCAVSGSWRWESPRG
jgi:hypothetical protein